MSRIQTGINFDLSISTKVEVGFLYKIAPKSRLFTFQLCYSIKDILSGEEELTNITVNASNLTKAFEKRILLEYFIKNQTSNISFSGIRLRIQSENDQAIKTYKYLFAPKRVGLSKDLDDYKKGVYICRCEVDSNKTYFFKLRGFSIPPSKNTADIFINDLVPDEDLTFSLKVVGQDQKIYELKFSFCGKLLKSNWSRIINLIEEIEPNN